MPTFPDGRLKRDQEAYREGTDGGTDRRVRDLDAFNLHKSEIIDSTSTNTPLGIDGQFLTSWIDVENYSNLTVMVFSDQNSAIDGFKVEYSSDGVNVDDTDAFTIFSATGPGGSNRQFSFPLPSKYFRINYTNGSVSQTIFRLQTKRHNFRPKPSSHTLAGNLTPDNDAELVKSVLAGEDESGNFQNVTLSPSGSIEAAVTDRPSELRGRTRVIIPINDVALSGIQSILYTVTANKTLYISSFLINALNTSITDGVFQLRDDTVVRVGFLIPSRVSGSSPSSFSSASPSLPEPLPFTTNVNFIQTAGNNRVSGYLIGYEEDNPA